MINLNSDKLAIGEHRALVWDKAHEIICDPLQVLARLQVLRWQSTIEAIQTMFVNAGTAPSTNRNRQSRSCQSPRRPTGTNDDFGGNSLADNFPATQLVATGVLVKLKVTILDDNRQL